MKVLMAGVISAAGSQSRDIMFNLLINVQHHTLVAVDVKMPKAELGSHSNFATIPIGVNAAFKPRDIFGIKHGMIGREQCVGKTS